MTDRIIIRHISGSKSNTTENYPLVNFTEITIGRDSSSVLAFAPNEDLVGRKHARIVRNPANPMEFTIVDLQSGNGTFVNGSRVEGSRVLKVGDRVLLGQGGPEFEFDLDPRPAAVTLREPAEASSRTTNRDFLPPTRVPGLPYPSDTPKVLLRHRSGSKSGQLTEIPVLGFTELTFGRDPAAGVVYDATLDDLVGRIHAKLVADAGHPGQYYLLDLNSTNGTFLNGQRITNATLLQPGDVVRFGKTGPEFEFGLNPPPAPATRVDGSLPGITRVAEQTAIVATRRDDSEIGATRPGERSEPPKVINLKNGVGQTTVMRIVDGVKTQSRLQLYAVASVLLAIVVGVGSYAGWSDYKHRRELAAQQAKLDEARRQTDDQFQRHQELIKASDEARRKAEEQMARLMPMAPETFSSVAKATVFIETGWKLVNKNTGEQLYRYFVPNQYKDEKGQVREYLPGVKGYVYAYLQLGDGTIEPWLTTDNRYDPIGSRGTGSGFIINENGTILTNRHVAAGWESSYYLGRGPAPVFRVVNGRPVYIGNLDRAPYWVPSRSKQTGFGSVTGQHVYLDVTLPGSTQRIKANLSRVSSEHDVALIRIDAPGTLPKLELVDVYDTIQPNEPVNVVGYPGDAPVEWKKNDDKTFDPKSQYQVVPEPTSGQGIVSRILRSDEKEKRESDYGDAFMLGVNSTSHGSSGSPVCNNKGQVIGVFYAGVNGEDKFTLAVPVRFAHKLINGN